ncbi:ATP-binding response regulator [Chitinophaga alhagiae]|uniref:ATP-binding response regulator n=1 Tax=Chitinophaga alhagiae TaxID=2203219 RepID=UPI000E5C4632|nr:ATP-binding protein [Chitinophaga alhagiae]
MSSLISQTFRARLQHIFKLGTSRTSVKEEARRIRVVNIVSFATGILVAVYGIAFHLLLHSLLILIPAVFVFCPAFFCMIWLNSRGYFNASRIGLQAIFILIILYYGAILGRVTEVQLLAVFLMSVALLVSRPQEKAQRIICVSMPIICLVALEFNYYFHIVEPLPLSAQTQNMYRWMVMPVVLFLNYLAISLYQRNIMDLLRVLRSRNTALVRSRNEVLDQRMQLAKYSEELEDLVHDRTMALQTANDAKTRFISELSHEIRNPLNAILGISELLTDALGQPDSEARIREMARNLHATSHNILELVNSVLELSKIEAGKTDEVKMSDFSLREWLHNAVNIYQSIASKKSVFIHLEIDSRFPEMIIGDKLMLGQVVNNLLSNSIKFTPAGKNIRVRCFHNLRNMFIQVCDEGRGIAAQQLNAIFKPFEQGDSDVYREFGGSGLGLAIAKRKVELMGGSIEVSSQQGEGTNFLIALPLQVSTENGPQAAGELPLLPAGAKVVVMDDNAIDHTIMKHFLARIGIAQAGFAKNGLEGIELARQMQPDVILMDLHMPVMSGRETFFNLRQEELLKHIPIVAVSSDAFKEQEQEYIAMGMDGYIRKPVEIRVLHGVLEKLLYRAPNAARGAQSHAC